MMVLLVHAVLVGGALWAAARLYAGPGALQQVFAQARRPRALRWLYPLWALALVGVLAAGWTYRGLAWPELGLGARVLLAAQGVLEAFITTHWLGFVWHGWRSAGPVAATTVARSPADVLVLVPAADEREPVLERSLASLARLEGGTVVLVDNSATEAGRRVARQVAARQGVRYLAVEARGSKAAALNDALAALPSLPLVAVFDADQKVDPAFLDHVLPVLAADKRVAFVQTPQAYEDAHQSLVGRAAAQQEALQYDCVLESKDRLGWVRCCGTGFVLRTDALRQVGGFDERCVAEDLSTGHALHRAGWRSRYLRRTLAVGLAPEDLGAYWRQQRRWATASAQLLRTLLSRPGAGGWALWLDTLWSTSFYVVVVALPLLVLLPAASAIAGLQGPAVSSGAVFSALPMYALVLALPYVTMGLRGYALRDLLLLQGLLSVTTPHTLRGLAAGFLGGPVVFQATRRATRAALPWAQALVWLSMVGLSGLVLRHAATQPSWAPLLLYLALSAYTFALGHLWLFARYRPARASSSMTSSGTSSLPQPALRTRR